MGNILSAVSGQFSKALILGAFFPTGIFLLLAYLFVAPLFPAEWAILKPLEILDPQWRVVLLLIGTIVLSGALYNLNTPIIRLYEGYPWENTSFGKSRKRRYQSKHDVLVGQMNSIPALNSEFQQRLNPPEQQPANGGNPQQPVQAQPPLDEATRNRYTSYLNAVDNASSPIARDLMTRFPNDRDIILPTELGNVFRSFETYPQRQYGISSVTIWPKLVAAIDKEYAGSIDDMKTTFDFMLNSSLLSALLAVALLVTGLFFPSTLSDLHWVPWLFEILGFGMLSALLYKVAIGRATAYGALVKGAFDLYRNKLLEQLGYKREFTDHETEKLFWTRLSRWFFYGDTTPNTTVPPYSLKPKAQPTTSAVATPTDKKQKVSLEVSRGMEPANGQIILVKINVRNTTRARPVQAKL